MVKITVYADVLVAINILVTYLILVCVRQACRIPSKKPAVALAAVLGGLSSLIIFLKELPLSVSIFFKLIVAVIVTSVAFLPTNIKIFFKTFFAFFGISFLFGGIMYAVEITFNPQNILYFNGTVYFDMSITYLVGSVFVIYGAFLMCDYFLSRKTGSNEIFKVKITFRGITAIVQGFADNGNNLKDALTGRSVIVAQFSAVEVLFTPEERQFFKSESFANIPDSLKTKFHLVSCKTVSGKSLLPCVIPDKVEIAKGNKKATADFVSLALCNGELSSGEYGVLLNSDIFNLSWRENKDEILHNRKN